VGIDKELRGADFETRNTRRIFDFFRVAFSRAAGPIRNRELLELAISRAVALASPG
jgi:hypothetical protein